MAKQDEPGANEQDFKAAQDNQVQRAAAAGAQSPEAPPEVSGTPGPVWTKDIDDKALGDLELVAGADVGHFQKGDAIPQGHWRPSRLRSLAERGLVVRK